MSHILNALFLASILLSSSSIMPFTFAQNSTLILSPLKQLEDGISAHDIKCKEGLMLIVKTSDSSPACVKPETIQKLIQRGWGTLPLPISDNKFISKTDANTVFTKLLDKKNYPSNIEKQIQFSFLKYNGTQNGVLQFILYKADPDSKEIGDKLETVNF